MSLSQRKNSTYIYFTVVFFIGLLTPRGLFAQQKSIIDHFPDVQIKVANCPAKGYYFISSDKEISAENPNYIAIIDSSGYPVFFRLMNEAVHNFRIQPNGYLSFDLPGSKSIIILDSSYNYIDTITDFEYEFNGTDYIIDKYNNSYILGYENRSFNMSTIIEGGNTNAIIKESIIQKLDRYHNPVFTWKTLGHFNITDANFASPFLDLKASVIDYVSISDIEVDSDSTILVVCKYLDEITKININSGQIVWRLGGKNNEFTFINEGVGFSHPISVRKLNNGNIILFDSGALRNEKISTIIEYKIDEANKTATLLNRFGEREKIFANEDAGLQKLNNGNILVYWGENNTSVTEFNINGSKAYEMNLSSDDYSKSIFKSEWKTNIFKPVIDSINFGMWDYTIFRYILILKNNSDSLLTVTGLSNKTTHFYTEQTVPFQIPARGTKNIIISYYPESLQTSVVKDVLTVFSDYNNQRIAQQVFLIGFRDDFIAPTVEIYPKNNSTNINVDTTLYFLFNEPVRFRDDKEITNQNVSDLIVLKSGNENGADIQYSAAISTNKNAITIIPKFELQKSQTYYLALNGDLEDFYNNSLNTGNYSSFTTELSSSISPDIEYNIQISPNPASDFLEIFSKQLPIYEVSIIDLQGKMRKIFKQLNNNHLTINLTSLEEGIYIVNLKLQNGYFKSCKIIIY